MNDQIRLCFLVLIIVVMCFAMGMAVCVPEVIDGGKPELPWWCGGGLFILGIIGLILFPGRERKDGRESITEAGGQLPSAKAGGLSLTSDGDAIAGEPAFVTSVETLEAVDRASPAPTSS